MLFIHLRGMEVLMISRNSWGGTMGRIFNRLLLLIFLVGDSMGVVRAGDSGASPSKTGYEAAATTPITQARPKLQRPTGLQLNRKCKSCGIWSSLKRKNSTSCEHVWQPSKREWLPKEAPASTAVVSPGMFQPTNSAAITSVSALPNTMKQDAANGPNENKSPLSFKIGSAEFTPGGFLDFTSLYRSTNLGSGIATAFGAIPFNNVLPQAGLSETRFSSQYSRLSLKVDTDLTESTSLTGYVETDFLGFQPANAYQTADSDSLRLRVYWADVQHGKWEVLAGQEWSLLTPNRVGLSPLTQDVFTTVDEDPNFQVGLTWARQAQVRVVYHPTSNWAVGLSLENPQQYVPASVVFPSTFFTSQFDNGSGSTSAASSATNTAVPNVAPDIIVKTAFDAHPAGRSLHMEVAGLLRNFKVLNDLTTSPTTNTITGDGGSINLNYEVIHNLHLIANTFYSDGGGQYILGWAPT